eukprot:365797-Chlamydomonas_euryale.AAC.5
MAGGVVDGPTEAMGDGEVRKGKGALCAVPIRTMTGMSNAYSWWLPQNSSGRSSAGMPLRPRTTRPSGDVLKNTGLPYLRRGGRQNPGVGECSV